MDLDNKVEEIEKVDADSTSDNISFSENSAVQIVSINQETKEFELNEEGLSSILNHEKAKDKPVVVLSIAGDFRKGKSFILNFFLRYLKAAESGNAENWLPDGEQPLKGFSWRSGMEGDTSGILLWSEPFNLKLENGSEVAVLLMDTQGCFDSEHTFRESATVFALSTMLSSIQIYNIFHNLQEDNLQFLQVYTEYGKLALENTKKSPFQKLVFLVRDWGFPVSCPFGSEGGKKALNERLAIKENQEPQLKKVREDLASCFEEICCYLMPYPGKKVATNPNFDGRISDIDEEFVEHLNIFVPNLFDIKNIPIKEIAGSKVTGNQLIEYFKVYFNTFKSNEIPEPKSIMEATSEANNFIALSSARASYIQEMEEVCGSKRPYVNPKYLETKHNEIYKRSLNCFYEFKKFGGEEFSKPFLEKLEQELSVEFEKYKNNNNAKNIFAVVGAPLIFLIHAIVLSVISKVFDIIGITILANFIFFFVTVSLVVLVLYLFLKMQGTFPEFVQGLDDVADKIKSISIEFTMNYFGRNALSM